MRSIYAGRRSLLLSAALCVLIGAPVSAAPMSGAFAQDRSGVIAETVRIEGPRAGMKLGLRHVGPAKAASDVPAVLILHGTNVPTSGNADYPFGGRSTMSALAEAGFDVWGLDFYGFGTSDRYPAMNEPPERNPPLGQAAESADQVAAAIRFLRQRSGNREVMLIGDSGGSLAAGILAATPASGVSHLVLFGPIPALSGGQVPSALPAYRLVTPDKLWEKFSQWAVDAGPPNALDAGEYKNWADTFLASDPESSTRSPPSVKIPNGRAADGAAIAAGKFPYDPGKIRVPTLIVMGETDDVTTFAGAQGLLASLRNAPKRRLVAIGHASHTIQFEAERGQLYRVIADFLREKG